MVDMPPQVAADLLREGIPAPAGAVSVWPWHEKDGSVALIVVIDPNKWVDTSKIPSSFQGFEVRVEYRAMPTVRMG